MCARAQARTYRHVFLCWTANGEAPPGKMRSNKAVCVSMCVTERVRNVCLRATVSGEASTGQKAAQNVPRHAERPSKLAGLPHVPNLCHACPS